MNTRSYTDVKRVSGQNFLFLFIFNSKMLLIAINICNYLTIDLLRGYIESVALKKQVHSEAHSVMPSILFIFRNFRKFSDILNLKMVTCWEIAPDIVILLFYAWKTVGKRNLTFILQSQGVSVLLYSFQYYLFLT